MRMASWQWGGRDHVGTISPDGLEATPLAVADASCGLLPLIESARGLSAADAYSLASIGVNYTVGEAVDAVLMVYAAIPKKIFSTNRAFWSRP